MEFFFLPSSSKSLVLLLWLLASVLSAAVAIRAEKESVIEMYLHDIVGGSNPTARPTTGLLGSIYSGQVPFASPVGFKTPEGGIPIPNANGALPTVNGVTGIPLASGLSGTTFAGNSQNNLQSQIAADGLGLGFGTITVIDDILTSQPELGSQAIGRAQGIYVASSADGSRQMMVFTAMFEGGEYGDSLNFYGVYKIGSTMSRLSITGGTGKFKDARGFAEVRSLIPPGQIATDGAETLLRIIVHLNHY
ncbi:dirigent protein 18-like [Neltuma alba]|uniref:dirigent protein 18-like n=1 Tax=Neltuma alba TaxID=207710 RepID=UPI0010A2BA0C|nr:dirigent protein 18-like [Prosopis alba]